MKALLLKDCRVNRFVLIFGVVMLFGPFAVRAGIGIYSKWRYDIALWSYADFWESTAMISLAASMLALAMLAGNVIAAERNDRSAEFLAYLPITRGASIASKLVLTLGSCLLVWGVCLLSAYGIAPRMEQIPEELIIGDASTGDMMRIILSTNVMLIGAAWCCSAATTSPAISAGCGLFAPFIVLCVLACIKQTGTADLDILGWYHGLCSVLGAISFVVGTVYYLRRVEP